jgi:hypothetical protein
LPFVTPSLKKDKTHENRLNPGGRQTMFWGE